MNTTIKKAVVSWNKAIDTSLKTGKGKYKDCLVRDLYDFKKVIKLISNKQPTKATNAIFNLDTFAQGQVPVKIMKFLITNTPTE